MSSVYRRRSVKKEKCATLSLAVVPPVLEGRRDHRCAAHIDVYIYPLPKCLRTWAKMRDERGWVYDSKKEERDTTSMIANATFKIGDIF